MSEHNTSLPDSLREEPSIAELIEAREGEDNGRRLEMAMLFDGLGSLPISPAVLAEIQEDIACLVGAELAEARDHVLRAGKALPLEGNEELHRCFNGLVNEIDRAHLILAERRS